MKKVTVCIFALAALWSFKSRAQQWTTSGSDAVTAPGINNVGIGTNTPQDKLSIDGNVGFQNSAAYRYIMGRSTQGLILSSDNDDFKLGATGIILSTFNTGGDVKFVSFLNGSSATAFDFLTDDVADNWRSVMKIQKSGELVPYGDIGFYHDPVMSDYRNIRGNSDKGLVFYSDGDPIHGSQIVMNSINNGGDIRFVSQLNAAGTTAFNFLTADVNMNYNTIMRVDKSGSIIPYGNIDFNPVSWYRYIHGNSENGLVLFSDNEVPTGSSAIVMNSVAAGGEITFISQLNGSSGTAFNFMTGDVNNNYTTPVRIQKGGKVIIGNVSDYTPNYEYKLYVEKGILTERVKVAMSNDQANWSDFVFDDDYKLKSLNEVEDYIKENKHLPEIPSTKEVHKEGLDLAQMDAKLLQKVEELTLYIIQQQKEIEMLKKKLGK